MKISQRHRSRNNNKKNGVDEYIYLLGTKQRTENATEMESRRGEKEMKRGSQPSSQI